MLPRIDQTGGLDPNSLFKDEFEEELGYAFGSLLHQQEAELLAELDRREQPEDPGPGWWETWGSTMAVTLAPYLINMVDVAVQTGAQGSLAPISWAEVLRQSENWANTYAFGLVNNINSSTQAELQAALSSFYTGQLSYDDMIARLSSQFGPVRAATIAATETARGFERGLDIYEDLLGRARIKTDRVWWAERGACALCAPNHGRYRERDGWTISGVPAHPRCRCWTEVVIVGGRGDLAADPREKLLRMAQPTASRMLDDAMLWEPDITASLLDLTNEQGGEMSGLEFRLKGQDSLARKLVAVSQDEAVSIEVASQRLTDTVRYTSLYQADDLVSGYRATAAALEDQGYSLHKFTNYFGSGGAYEGLNTWWKDGEGHIFELQFHTPASLQIKEANHTLYELWRVSQDSAERTRLWDAMIDAWQAAEYQRPAGWEELGTFGS